MSLIHKGQIIASNYITGDTLPIGSQIPFGSLTIPDNWLLCDGRAISRVYYSELFAVIGTSYGAGNGTTTFNLPNKKGRTSVGYDTSQTEFNAVGKTGGAKTHTLTVDEIPSHTHTFYAIKDAINTDSSGGGVKASNGQGNNAGTTTPTTDFIGNTGGGLAHNNLQPYETDVWIIKAKQSAGVVATVVDDLLSDSPTNALSANMGRQLNERTKVLWDNPSPGSDFAGQTITLDLSNYSYVTILTNNTSLIIKVGAVGVSIRTQDSNGNYSGVWFIDSRQINVNTNNIIFTDNRGMAVDSTNKYGIRNNINVPLQIIGHK